MSTATKLTNWNGTNKNAVRAEKIRVLRQARKDGTLPERSNVLSFPGSTAKFERALIENDLCLPEDIVGIQTYEKMGDHIGEPYLKRLINLRNAEMPGMWIWPYNFTRFTECYAEDKVVIPNFFGPAKNRPKWLKFPIFRDEMNSFAGLPALEFEILDIDICGSFCQTIADDVSRLLENGKFAESGYFFFTHLKGRDGRGGRMRQFFSDYFSCMPGDLLPEDWPVIEDMPEDSEFFDFARYTLVPSYFAMQGYMNGYQIWPVKLMEYRDRNKDTNGGVYMLQWFFRFSAVNDITNESEETQLRRQLQLINDQLFEMSILTD